MKNLINIKIESTIAEMVEISKKILKNMNRSVDIDIWEYENDLCKNLDFISQTLNNTIQPLIYYYEPNTEKYAPFYWYVQDGRLMLHKVCEYKNYKDVSSYTCIIINNAYEKGYLKFCDYKLFKDIFWKLVELKECDYMITKYNTENNGYPNF